MDTVTSQFQLVSIDRVREPWMRKRSLGDVTALARSIEELGLLHPITVTADGTLVSGRHRLEACRQLGWTEIPAIAVTLDALHVELAEIDENLIRNDLTALERAEHLKRRKDIYESLHPETKHGGDRKSPAAKSSRQNGDSKNRFTAETAAKTGASERTIQREVQIAERIPEDLRDALRDTPAANNQAELLKLSKLKREDQAAVVDRIVTGHADDLRSASSAVAKKKRLEKLAAISANSSPLDDGSVPVPVLLADPPWKYDHESVDAWGNDNHYPAMSMDELAGLAVDKRTTGDAILFLWSPSPKLEDAFTLIRAWGFTYKSSAVWDKERPGRGHYFFQQHEMLLVATRGNWPTPPQDCRSSSVIRTRKGKHSVKPVEVYEIIERMYPGLPKLELFARGAPRPGWTAWGNQVEAAAAPEEVLLDAHARDRRPGESITVAKTKVGGTKIKTVTTSGTVRRESILPPDRSSLCSRYGCEYPHVGDASRLPGDEQHALYPAGSCPAGYKEAASPSGAAPWLKLTAERRRRSASRRAVALDGKVFTPALTTSKGASRS